MKKLLWLLALSLSLIGPTAGAADPVVCSVNIGTGAATTTSSATTGTCSWSAGAVVLMQCDQDVYIDSTSGGTATSADQLVDFTVTRDPYPIYLDGVDQHISLLAVNTAGTCKFMTTKRRRPR